jgi:transposase
MFCYALQVMNEPVREAANYDELLRQNREQQQTILALKQQVDWFLKQMLNETSEKSHIRDFSTLPLFAQDEIAEKPPREKEVAAHTRRTRGRTENLGDNHDSGLRFDDGVEIVEEVILPDEVQDLDPDEYEVIGSEISDTLGSRKTKLFVHRRIYQKVKLKNAAGSILKQPVETKIFANSYLSAGVIADMFLDKCLYHIPLYRQHQRLKQEGVYLARSTLTANFIRYAQLLQPLMEPHQQSILLSRILAIDETPMKVGVDRKKHKMKRGYVWPVIGDNAQILYIYNQSRGAKVLEAMLKGYHGTILSDGYSAYTSYVNNFVDREFSDTITHATCWVHARRKFTVLGEASEQYQKAMQFYRTLYQIEESLKGKSQSEVLAARNKLSLPVVDRYFEWLESFAGTSVMGTNQSLAAAVRYSRTREDSMRVFLRDPQLALDTNYLEREIRPIAVGRKNFLFCWSEVGAESLCTIQSLIRTCLLQEIDPRVYLIDVIQRIAKRDTEKDDISDLIPVIWKDEYQQQPLSCSAEQAVFRKNSQQAHSGSSR